MNRKTVSFKFDGDVITAEVRRGRRIDNALYESLYATVVTSLPEDSPVLVPDVRAYAKICSFASEVKTNGKDGLITPDGNKLHFMQPNAAPEHHIDALGRMMECYPELIDRLVYEIEQVNASLGRAYNPAEVGENLDSGGRQIGSASVPSPAVTPDATSE